jgi:hypothetical protein
LTTVPARRCLTDVVCGLGQARLAWLAKQHAAAALLREAAAAREARRWAPRGERKPKALRARPESKAKQGRRARAEEERERLCLYARLEEEALERRRKDAPAHADGASAGAGDGAVPARHHELPRDADAPRLTSDEARARLHAVLALARAARARVGRCGAGATARGWREGARLARAMARATAARRAEVKGGGLEAALEGLVLEALAAAMLQAGERAGDTGAGAGGDAGVPGDGEAAAPAQVPRQLCGQSACAEHRLSRDHVFTVIT